MANEQSVQSNNSERSLLASNEAKTETRLLTVDDSNNLNVVVNELAVGDIQIGAVEVKDADSDDRLVVNTDGSLNVNTGQSTKRYAVSDVDNDAEPNYYGFTDASGNWYIMKEETGTYRYVAGTSGYTTAWTNRVSQTYDYRYNVTIT